ncbi:carbohydrate kinase family protein [Candidatus Dependentiae bacterium]|nr:carbohydrate kinase family protein [Candidatus Dependentiae bacterium]
MKKILTIGGATQDIYLDQEGADCMSIMKKDSETRYMLFKSGAKIEVKKLLYFTGGGATNSAVSLKRQGFDVSCFCKIGNDKAGEFILKDLEKENINISKILKTDKEQSGTSFIINSLRRERTIFAYRGANGYLKKEDIPFDRIKESDQIYITSLSHDSANLLPEITSIAKENNTKVAINPGISQLAEGSPILRDSLKNIDILIMNSDEAKSFMITLIESDENYKETLKSSRNFNQNNKKIKTANLLESPILYENYYFSIRKFFKEVIKMGPQTVVITDGENGVYVANNNNIFFHPSIETEIEDTLGAGDSFGSCFVGSLLSGKSIEQSLKRGIINASSVISMMGAKPGLLTNEELEKREKKLEKNLTQKFNL